MKIVASKYLLNPLRTYEKQLGYRKSKNKEQEKTETRKISSLNQRINNLFTYLNSREYSELENDKANNRQTSSANIDIIIPVNIDFLNIADVENIVNKRLGKTLNLDLTKYILISTINLFEINSSLCKRQKTEITDKEEEKLVELKQLSESLKSMQTMAEITGETDESYAETEKQFKELRKELEELGKQKTRLINIQEGRIRPSYTALKKVRDLELEEDNNDSEPDFVYYKLAKKVDTANFITIDFSWYETATGNKVDFLDQATESLIQLIDDYFSEANDILKDALGISKVTCQIMSNSLDSYATKRIDSSQGLTIDNTDYYPEDFIYFDVIDGSMNLVSPILALSARTPGLKDSLLNIKPYVESFKNYLQHQRRIFKDILTTQDPVDGSDYKFSTSAEVFNNAKLNYAKVHNRSYELFNPTELVTWYLGGFIPLWITRRLYEKSDADKGVIEERESIRDPFYKAKLILKENILSLEFEQGEILNQTVNNALRTVHGRKYHYLVTASYLNDKTGKPNSQTVVQLVNYLLVKEIISRKYNKGFKELSTEDLFDILIEQGGTE